MNLTTVSEIKTWLTSLHELIESNKCNAPGFIKPFHLVTLALTMKRNGTKGLTLPEAISSYAARMDLWRAAGLEAPDVSRGNSTGRFLPAVPLLERNDVHLTANALVKIAEHQSNESETMESLGIVLEELIENCFAHSAPARELNLYGLACAQAWPKGCLAQIAIADPGVGVRAALINNPEYLDLLSSRNACEFATEYGVSGKLGRGHSGYGLALARGVLEKNKGNLIVLSGDEAFACVAGERHTFTLTAPWHGTLIVFEWRTDCPLDVGAVYAGWPQKEGFTDEDFDF